MEEAINIKQKIGLFKISGITLILSGILFLVQAMYLLPISVPPANNTDFMLWLDKWKTNLSMVDELLFFETILVIPAIVTLYQLLIKIEKIKTIFGCGLLLVYMPVNLVVAIILGRLVYPVYQIEYSPEIYKFVLSMYYGGMHMAALILSIATILLSFVIRKSSIGKFVAYLGFVTGLMDLLGAFPWLLTNEVVFLTQLFHAAWFAVLGMQLFRKAPQEEGY
ncbi:MAG: hypothetical protein QM644_13500 [Mobilitalea sp.]